MKPIIRRSLAFIVLGAVLVGLAACAPAMNKDAPVVATTGLRPALSGERDYFDLDGFGPVAYYQDTQNKDKTGRPLILVHSVNAAASAYEMKPIWDSYVGTRPIYALELPGFGSSARPDTVYTTTLMTSALVAFVQKLNVEADVVGLSLGSEFAARAALQTPLIKSLSLISPSGLGAPRGGSQEANANDSGQRLYGFLRAFGTPLYGLLRTRWGIELFLKGSFYGPIDQGVVDYARDTSGQRGAKNAPLYFISGQLFTQDAYGELYSKLNIPTQVLYDKDPFVSFDRLTLFAEKTNVKTVRILNTNGLPQFEKMPELKAALDTFWANNQSH